MTEKKKLVLIISSVVLFFIVVGPIFVARFMEERIEGVGDMPGTFVRVRGTVDSGERGSLILRGDNDRNYLLTGSKTLLMNNLVGDNVEVFGRVREPSESMTVDGQPVRFNIEVSEFDSELTEEVIESRLREEASEQREATLTGIVRIVHTDRNRFPLGRPIIERDDGEIVFLLVRALSTVKEYEEERVVLSGRFTQQRESYRGEDRRVFFVESISEAW